MATYTYSELKTRYDDFHHPVIVLKINGKDFAENNQELVVSDIEVDLTCGFEASIASFSLYNTFDTDNSCFRIQEAKKYILLGSSVEIALGYEGKAQVVFCGYIARVNFQYEAGGMPGIRVTAMDVKGAMMANHYSRQVKADSYGDAVKEILENNKGSGANASYSDYMTMQANGIIKNISVAETPDKPSVLDGGKKPADRTMEMVAESDYEFVVKAAKKFNYEFFVECGNVYFRKAKSGAEVMMEMGPGDGLWYFDVEYDITGLVRNIEVRGMDVGQGKLIQAEKTLDHKLSFGNQAKDLMKNAQKVYLDASIHSENDAKYRVESLEEEISYRLGTLECECIGLPELLPGKYFIIKAMGTPPENQFYIQRVVHKMNQEDGFVTKLYGKAAAIQAEKQGGIAGGLI